MKISLKQFHALCDEEYRVTTNMGDIKMMLEYIYNQRIYTHQLVKYIDYLRLVKPDWYLEGKSIIDGIKNELKTPNSENINYLIDIRYHDTKIELGRLSNGPY